MNGKSLVAMVRSEDRVKGIAECLRLLGGIGFLRTVADDILGKPNCVSSQPFPANTYPDT